MPQRKINKCLKYKFYLLCEKLLKDSADFRNRSSLRIDVHISATGDWHWRQATTSYRDWLSERRACVWYSRRASTARAAEAGFTGVAGRQINHGLPRARAGARGAQREARVALPREWGRGQAKPPTSL